MVKKEEFTFDSRDGKTKLYAVRWVPEGKVVCILQIVHGMSEHMGRYEEVAQFFGERGILVTGNDHLGHGKSVPGDGIYGYFCEQDPATVAVRDIHRLKKMTQEDYPGIPYVILGHSMGSFMLRNYLFRYGTGIEGALICGTGSRSVLQNWIFHAVVAIARLFVGEKHTAKMIDRIAFGGYNKRITDPKTSSDWLCRDEKVIEAYQKDEMCGFIFTVNGFKTLFYLLNRMNKKENLDKMPKNLPVYFLSGDMDPVGDYGEGVRKAYEDFRGAGMERVSMKLYPGARHELVNETNKIQIFEDIYPWIMERVKEYQI